MGEARSRSEIWTPSRKFVAPPCGVLVNVIVQHMLMCRCSLWTFSFLEWRTDWRIFAPFIKETICIYTLRWPFLWRAGGRYCYLSKLLFAVSLKDGLDFICASSVASWIPIWIAFAWFRKEHGFYIMPHTMLVTFGKVLIAIAVGIIECSVL